MSDGGGLPGLVARIYGAALRLLPEAFRRSFGAAAMEDFRDAAKEAWGQRGAAGVAAALGRGLLDIVARAPGEWARTRRDGEGWASTWTREMRMSARALLRRPGFTGIVIVTLGLGLAVNVAIFTVVNAVLLRPLPYPDSERIVVLQHHAPGLELDAMESSPGMTRFYAERSGHVFQTVALANDALMNLTGGVRPEQVEVGVVTPAFFEVMGSPLALGRAFTEEESLPGGPDVAVLTWDAWQTRFGGDRGVIGRTLELDGVPSEIVGVLPAGFAFPSPGLVAFVPERQGPDSPFGSFGRTSVARLAPGVDLDAARTLTSQLQATLPEYFPDMTADFFEGARWGVSVDPLRDRIVGDVRTSLWILLGTVGFVLLIACANVANLFLVRAEARQREVAIRAAMGASRARLAVTFLSESLILAAVAGALGVLLAAAGVKALVAMGQELPRMHEIGLDTRVLAFAAGLSLLAALGLGALPVLRYLGSSFGRVLRDGGRTLTQGRDRHRARNLLVASQLALALVLLVGSGLMLRTFQELRRVDTGIDPSDVLAVRVSLGEGRTREEAVDLYGRVVDRVRGLPGVVEAGVTNSLPLDPRSTSGGSFSIRSDPRDEGDLLPVSMNVALTDGLLESLDVPVLAGRAPTAADRAGEPAVVWVNEAFSQQFLEGRALGEFIGVDAEGPWAEIVGVVGDVRHFALREEVRPLIYTPAGDSVFADRGSLRGMVLVVEAGVDPLHLASAVRAIVEEVDPTVPVTTVQSMRQVVRSSMADTSFTMVLLVLAAGVALLLGAVGVYGVISYVVSQRTREIGVRIALGARADDVRRMVVRQGLAVALVGVTAGLGAAFGLTRLMESLLFGVSPTDPFTFVAVPLVLVAVAALASWIPARRASRVDPSEALRSD